jgi:hypothetical protein
LGESKLRSDSSLSRVSTNTSFDSKSIDISESNNSEVISRKTTCSNMTQNELFDVEFKYCDAKCFNVELKELSYHWLEGEVENNKKQVILEEWRNNIFNELLNRNLREYVNIDKISKPYQNGVRPINVLFVSLLIILLTF